MSKNAHQSDGHLKFNTHEYYFRHMLFCQNLVVICLCFRNITNTSLYCTFSNEISKFALVTVELDSLRSQMNPDNVQCCFPVYIIIKTKQFCYWEQTNQIGDKSHSVELKCILVFAA